MDCMPTLQIARNTSNVVMELPMSTLVHQELCGMTRERAVIGSTMSIVKNLCQQQQQQQQ